jgi:hypothetical protein
LRPAFIAATGADRQVEHPRLHGRAQHCGGRQAQLGADLLELGLDLGRQLGAEGLAALVHAQLHHHRLQFGRIVRQDRLQIHFAALVEGSLDLVVEPVALAVQAVDGAEQVNGRVLVLHHPQSRIDVGQRGCGGCRSGRGRCRGGHGRQGNGAEQRGNKLSKLHDSNLPIIGCK